MVAMIVIFIFLWVVGNIVYGGIGTYIFDDIEKLVEEESGYRKYVADFKYNNLLIILNNFFFLGYFFLLIYFSAENDYNHFTDSRKGKQNKFLLWLLQPKH